LVAKLVVSRLERRVLRLDVGELTLEARDLL
jgi:hypothetical protein